MAWDPSDTVPSKVGAFRKLLLELMDDSDIHIALHKKDDLNFEKLSHHHTLNPGFVRPKPTPNITIPGNGEVDILISPEFITVAFFVVVQSCPSGGTMPALAITTRDSSGTIVKGATPINGTGSTGYNLFNRGIQIDPTAVEIRFVTTGGSSDSLTSILYYVASRHVSGFGAPTVANPDNKFTTTNTVITQDFSTKGYFDPLGAVVTMGTSVAVDDTFIGGGWIDDPGAITVSDTVITGQLTYVNKAGVPNKTPAAIGFNVDGNSPPTDGTGTVTPGVPTIIGTLPASAGAILWLSP